jgi:predicted nucleic acid-binding protein
MNIRKSNRVFFDSSVLIAGLASPDGGSAVLLAMAEMRLITPVISEMVVTEVIRNIDKKLPRCLPQYHRLFKSLPFEIADPTEDFIISARKLINEKDAILAAAMNAKIDFLVTLDRHFLKADLQKLPFTVCSPGELLESVECQMS